jgi:hypothetical protein
MLLQFQSGYDGNFTQGDNVVLMLQATDDNGNPINITGATFVSQILGPNSPTPGPITFGNSQHAITNAVFGMFTLTLAQADSNNCGIGYNKDIISELTISSAQTTYRGMGILNIYPASPVQ